jgi:beta-N-acetylhexosaminidase
VEESARRIMTAKYDLGLVDQRLTPIDSIDRVVGSKDVLALATEIAEHAVTLVRDEDKLVPLKNLKSDTKIFNLAVTNGDDRLWVANTFVAELDRRGVKVETIVLDDRSSDKEVQQAIAKASAADVVLASLYGRVRTGQARSVGLPEPGARALSSLIAAKKPIVGISFGNPYLLQSFPALRTYLVAYGDMPSLQQATARALLGEIDIVGRLPISLPGLYSRGTGIQLKASK